MKNTLFLIAEYANLSKDNKLNVMGIFRSILAPQFPARHSTMHLVARLEAELGEQDDRQVTILLRDPDGAEIFRIAQEITIPKAPAGQFPEINLILELRDIIFQQPGPHQFVILVDKDFKGQLPLHVLQVSPANAIQSPKAP